MESHRLWKRFKRLLRGETPDFSSAWEKTTQILQKAYKKKEIRAFVAKIQHLMKDYPDLFTPQNNIMARSWPQIFGIRIESNCSIAFFVHFLIFVAIFHVQIIRMQHCALFQLYYNTTPRRSKQGRLSLPIERFGVNLQGKNWVQLLFEPLPQLLIITV